MNDFFVIFGYIIIGSVVGYGVKSLLDCFELQSKIKDLNNQLIDLDKKKNKK